MTSTEILELVDFNRWANARVVSVAARLPGEQLVRVAPSGGSVRDLLVRMMSAEAVWLARWRGKPAGIPYFAAAFTHVGTIWECWQGVSGELRRHLAGLDDAALAAPLVYRTKSGREVVLSVHQTVVHLVSQASYHRGQLTVLLHGLGVRGVHTDFTSYLRAGSGAKR